jgi:multidrug efflux pump
MSVPLVLAITFVGMLLLGIDFQRISLGALIIALGLLVDDAIIAVEMMMVKLEQGASRLEAATYAYTSTAFPMLTGTLITAAGFVPGWASPKSSAWRIHQLDLLGGRPVAGDLLVRGGPVPRRGSATACSPTPRPGHHDPYSRRLNTLFRSLVTWCISLAAGRRSARHGRRLSSRRDGIVRLGPEASSSRPRQRPELIRRPQAGARALSLRRDRRLR